MISPTLTPFERTAPYNLPEMADGEQECAKCDAIISSKHSVCDDCLENELAEMEKFAIRGDSENAALIALKCVRWLCEYREYATAWELVPRIAAWTAEVEAA